MQNNYERVGPTRIAGRISTIRSTHMKLQRQQNPLAEPRADNFSFGAIDSTAGGGRFAAARLPRRVAVGAARGTDDYGQHDGRRRRSQSKHRLRYRCRNARGTMHSAGGDSAGKRRGGRGLD